MLVLLRRVADHPGSAAGAEALARLAAHSPDAEEAAESASLLLEHHRDHPAAVRAAELLGHYRAARGEYRTAARYYQLASTYVSGVEADRLLVLRGRALLGAGDFADAREVFNDVQTRQPGGALGAASLLGLADTALLEGQHEIATGLYRGYLERFPDADGAAIAWSQLASALERLDRSEEAMTALSELVRRHPESVEAAAARDRLRSGDRRTPAASGGTQEAPSVQHRGLYSLQVGAFGREDNAQELARQLTEAGLEDVRIEREVRDDGKQFFRVRVGSYRDPEEAEAAGKRLRAAHGLAGQVVSR
jgi:cell division septation protein DedD